MQNPYPLQQIFNLQKLKYRVINTSSKISFAVNCIRGDRKQQVADMTIDFYYFPPSPPCRSVMLLAKAIGVHLNLKLINVLNGETMDPEFVKINPQHVVPTLDDSGFILCESRPIMGYLVSKYAKNDSLYPRNPKMRGLVDQMLYFDIGALYANLVKCYFPVLLGKANVIDAEKYQTLERSCEVLDRLIQGNLFVAGEELTIADISISTTIAVLLCFNFDIGRYDHVASWYDRCKTALEKYGFEEVHGPGTKLFKDMYNASLKRSA